MNKLPAKQIYLLTIIIVGIIALSVYSTYALFTLETETSDIVAIHTPKSLIISENIYEYQQINVEPNKITSTDIDIYNSFDYDVCYSIWYKVVGNNIDNNKVQIFELANDTLTSSGVLTPTDSIRVTITIINDNEEPVKINLGTIGAKKENDSCSLNLASDKNLISSSYKNIEILGEKLLEEKDNEIKNEANYITYKDETEIITYKNTDRIYISDKFTYDNEIFTLENPKNLTIQEIAEKKYLENDIEVHLEYEDIYFCKEDNKCSILYKITEIEQEEIKEEATLEQNEEDEVKEFEYYIKKYDKLIGYMEGTSGLRKINEQDYVFYGDNPNNYIYYNCETDNPSTCELWRIIGLFYHEETEEYNIKITRNQSIGKHQIDSIEENEELTWQTSTLNKYLNEEYKFVNNYENFIEEYKQNIETLLSIDTEIKIEETITESKINILSLSDYIHASNCEINKINEYTEECLKNNWLNNIEIAQEWTMTLQEKIEIPLENADNEELTDEANENPENEEATTTEGTIDETNNQENNEEQISESVDNILINYAYSIGNSINEFNVNELLDVRPTIYLKSRMLLVGGEGTFESPYIIR